MRAPQKGKYWESGFTPGGSMAVPKIPKAPRGWSDISVPGQPTPPRLTPTVAPTGAGMQPGFGKFPPPGPRRMPKPIAPAANANYGQKGPPLMGPTPTGTPYQSPQQKAALAAMAGGEPPNPVNTYQSPQQQAALAAMNQKPQYTPDEIQRAQYDSGGTPPVPQTLNPATVMANPKNGGGPQNFPAPGTNPEFDSFVQMIMQRFGGGAK